GAQQRDRLRPLLPGGYRHLRPGLDRQCGVSAMKSAQTPLHRVEGLGASHSGTSHFWRERVTAAALAPLSLWFLYAMLGLTGTSVVSALHFLAHPWNALLMGAFIGFSLYHAAL